MLASVSLSLSLFLLRFFSLPPTRLLARAHTDTRFSPSSFNRNASTVRFARLSFSTSLFCLSFSPSPSHLSISLFILRSSRSRTVGYARSLAHIVPHLPVAPPPFLPLMYLSPSLAVLRARTSPICVYRQCTHASSPSLCRASKHGYRARARVSARERHGGCWTRGRHGKRDGENERG